MFYTVHGVEFNFFLTPSPPPASTRRPDKTERELDVLPQIQHLSILLMPFSIVRTQMS